MMKIAKYFFRCITYLRLFAVLLYRLVLASLQLSRDILRPTPHFHAGIIAYEAAHLRPRERVLLATLISLTPGTLTLDLDEAGTLFVHSLYAADRTAERENIATFDRLIVAARGEGGG